MIMAEILTLYDVAIFLWNFGNKYLLETRKGNFIWSDPHYKGGNNTIKPFEGSYDEWCKKERIPYGNYRGKHIIVDYCGSNVKIVSK